MAVSDNNLVSGNPMAYTRRATFAPIFNSAAVQVTSSVVGFHWREGQHFCADVNISFVAASSAQVVTLTMPQIDGQQLTIDSSVIASRGSQHFTNISLLGGASWMDQSGGGFRELQPVFFSSTEIRFHHNAGYLSGTDIANADAIKANLKVPIYGW